MKRILLTRSAEENSLLEGYLKGFEVISLPLISYTDMPIKWDDFRKYTYIIVTSKHAALIVARNFLFKAKIFVVGRESASILRSNHCLEIAHIASNASEIKDMLLSGAYDKSKIIYFSGNIISTDFEEITRQIIYEVEYLREISNCATLGEVEYVLLYSKNVAKVLLNLLKESNLLQIIRNSVVIAISNSVGDILSDHVSRIIYPSEPISREMINLLLEYEREQ